MIRVLVNNGYYQDYIKISPFESIYSLKYKIINKKKFKVNKLYDFYLIYNYHCLNDNKCLFEYNKNIFNDNNTCVIHIEQKLKGGKKSVFSGVMQYLVVGILFILYSLIVGSGIITVLSKIYSLLITKVIFYLFKGIFWFFGHTLQEGSVRWVNNIINLFADVGKYLVIYYFFYITTFYLTFYLFHYTTIYKFNWCKALKYSSSVSYKVTLLYVIIYVLLNLNVFTADTLISVSNYENVPNIIKASIPPLTVNIRDSVNRLKYIPFYLIPILGTPLMEFYHIFIDIFLVLFDINLAVLGNFSCNNKNVRLLGKLLTKFPKIPGATHVIDYYHLKTFLSFIKPGLLYYNDDNKLIKYIKNPDNGLKNRLNIMNYVIYYAIKFFTGVFCTVFTIMHSLKDLLRDLGGTGAISNYIKTGSIAGSMSLILYVIMLIGYLFFSFG